MDSFGNIDCDLQSYKESGHGKYISVLHGDVGDLLCDGSRHTRGLRSVLYHRLDGREQYTIHVPDGEELAVRVSILNQNGSLSLTIGKRDHAPVYTGNVMESGTFTVYLRESGDYSVTVDTNSHEGSYSLDWSNSDADMGAGAD